MGLPNRQIGWSQESNLLWYILSQLKKLTSVVFSLKEAATPKYKVFTALLTQSGGGFLDQLDSSTPTQNVTKGVTYTITNASDGDFLNVGAPNNIKGTSFVATNNDIPTSWGESGAALVYDTGAPVVTVLENTIGNIYFKYVTTGLYEILSNELFTENKTSIIIGPIYSNGELDKPGVATFEINSQSQISLATIDIETLLREDSMLVNSAIEIRVYN